MKAQQAREGRVYVFLRAAAYLNIFGGLTLGTVTSDYPSAIFHVLLGIVAAYIFGWRPEARYVR